MRLTVFVQFIPPLAFSIERLWSAGSVREINRWYFRIPPRLDQTIAGTARRHCAHYWSIPLCSFWKRHGHKSYGVLKVTQHHSVPDRGRENRLCGAACYQFDYFGLAKKLQAAAQFINNSGALHQKHCKVLPLKDDSIIVFMVTKLRSTLYL